MVAFLNLLLLYRVSTTAKQTFYWRTTYGEFISSSKVGSLFNIMARICALTTCEHFQVGKWMPSASKRKIPWASLKKEQPNLEIKMVLVCSSLSPVVLFSLLVLIQSCLGHRGNRWCGQKRTQYVVDESMVFFPCLYSFLFQPYNLFKASSWNYMYVD